MSQNKAIVIDLDGTLLKANSLRIFMKGLPGILLRRYAPVSALMSMIWMGLRYYRMVSHKKMKWHLTKLACRHLQKGDWMKLAAEMVTHINPEVKEFINSESYAKDKKYIATAAIEDYSNYICQLLNLDGVIATRHTRRANDYVEMRGQRKLEGIKDLLNREDLELRYFLTDHHDDLPTGCYFHDQTILVNPSKKSRAMFEQAGITAIL